MDRETPVKTSLVAIAGATTIITSIRNNTGCMHLYKCNTILITNVAINDLIIALVLIQWEMLTVDGEYV